MTLLEKIKRCVELVWDFEEIYDWSDIESFCGKELSTYPQHDEIMEYFKHIENLEKANEWYFVKDGDLPKSFGYYLVALTSIAYKGFVFEVVYFTGSIFTKEGEISDNVYAWKEIVLPKEVEE